MEILENKNDEELLKSSLAELAKASNELRCIRNDAEKVSSRISFLILLINTITDRLKDNHRLGD
jgi:hypothetical protein